MNIKQTVILLIFLFSILTVELFSQCQGSMRLTCQEEIDNFDCTEVNGDLFILGNDISNLNGLSSLQSIDGYLQIIGTQVQNVNGLENLTSIDESLAIFENENLTNLDGLQNLNTIGNFRSFQSLALSINIFDNPNLTDISGIYQATVDKGSVSIQLNIENGCCDVLNELNQNIGRTASFLVLAGAQGTDCESANAFCENALTTNCTGTISLSTQAAVNNFSSCSTIDGSLIIGSLTGQNSDISDLSPLSNITQITGALIVVSTQQLDNLNGLNNITEVGSILGVSGGGISDFTGLENIESIGGLLVESSALTSLDGLNNLNTINGPIQIESNDNLINLNSLSQIDSIDFSLIIENNGSILNLDGFSGLEYIGGELVIGGQSSGGDGNDALQNIDGLLNLKYIGADLYVRDNQNLTSIAGLQNLEFIGGTLVEIFNSNVTECCEIETAIANIGCDVNISAQCFNSCQQPSNATERKAYFVDADGDGFGDPFTDIDEVRVSCTPIPGLVDNNDDFDDSDPYSYEGAPERCDCVDNDDDGQIDEGVGFYPDLDGDGFGDENANPSPTCVPGYVNDNTDCDDTDPNKRPGLPDPQNGDGIDNDCDGLVDEDPVTGIPQTWYLDSDDDGFGDADNPLQSPTQPNGYVANNEDCDDTDENINPNATEICDGVDNNCDGDTDEGLLIEFYPDNDGDNFGDENANPTLACSAPMGFVDNNEDCDDDDASVTITCGDCPVDIFFSSQAEVDNFPLEYPNCTQIEGTVRIAPAAIGTTTDVSNLNGFLQLTSVEGDLLILGNPQLENLSGLANLNDVGGNFRISGNQLLTNMEGLENLTFVGTTLEISQSNQLTSLSGLDNLDTVLISLQVFENPVLTSMEGILNPNYIGSLIAGDNNLLSDINIFESINVIPRGLFIYNLPSLFDLNDLSTIDTALTIFIQDNNALTNLEGLQNLKFIDLELTIESNPSLNSISSLSNLEWVGGPLRIGLNNSLTSLSGLDNVDPNSFTELSIASSINLSFCNVQSICDYLNMGGIANISGNASGCADVSEVETACGITPPPPCPPGDIILTSQAEVDAFPNNCGLIDGDLIINGDDIFDLSNLIGIVEITGSLIIGDPTPGSIGNDILTTLNGLGGIVSVGGNIALCNNPELISTDGVSSLTSVGGNVQVKNCVNLTSITFVVLVSIGGDCIYINLPSVSSINIGSVSNFSGSIIIDGTGITTLSGMSGLGGLNSIGGDLFILNNPFLTEIDLSNLISLGGCLHLINNILVVDFSGFGNLQTIGENIRIIGNEEITNLDDFINLTTVNGSFIISENINLIDLSGLINLTSVVDSLVVSENPSLSQCCGLFPLLNSSSLPNTVIIENNLPDCNSENEILTVCDIDDMDGDGIPDIDDNCPMASNPDQINMDGDNFGLACDCDDDNVDVNPDATEIIDDGIDNNCDGICLCSSINDPVCANGITYDNACEAECAGVFNYTFGPCNPSAIDCSNITINSSAGEINISGLGLAPSAFVQVFDASWNTLFQCFDNCDNDLTFNFGNGTFYVLAKYLDTDFSTACELFETINISGTSTGGGGSGPTGDCSDLTYQMSANLLTITDINTSLISEVQVYDLSWNPVFSCFDNCGVPVSIPLAADSYQVRFKYYNSDYTLNCERLDTVIINDFLIGNQQSQFEFSAAKHLEHVELIWAHQNISNVTRYELQKANENLIFQNIHTELSEESERTETYRSYDFEPKDGSNFYRIALIHADQSVTFSEIKEIYFNDISTYTIFPNPANNFAQIDLGNSIGNTVKISISNNLGQFIKSYKIDEIYSKYYQLDLRELKEGYYWVWISVEGKRAIAVPLAIGRI